MAAILAIPTLSSENTARRYLGVAAVGSLHLAVIYVLLTALNIIPSPIPNPDVRFHWLPPDRPTKVINPIPPVGPANPFAKPKRPTPQPPIFQTAQPTPNSLPPPQNPGASEGRGTLPPPGVTMSANAVPGTHTIPRYPSLALRLAHEGNVRLRITIDERGNVTAADLLNSSGHEELDDAAIAWVKTHWRYTPAMLGGNPVQSTTNVVVTFRLDQAQ